MCIIVCDYDCAVTIRFILLTCFAKRRRQATRRLSQNKLHTPIIENHTVAKAAFTTKSDNHIIVCHNVTKMYHIYRNKDTHKYITLLIGCFPENTKQ